MSCTNNLKQMALAVHVFHDGMNGLPPATIGTGRASLFVLLFPFTEQTAFYELLKNGETANPSVHGFGRRIDGILGANDMLFGGSSEGGVTSNGSQDGIWSVLSPAARAMSGGVNYMTCPSRRSSGTVIEATGTATALVNGAVPGLEVGPEYINGPATDYAMVIRAVNHEDGRELNGDLGEMALIVMLADFNMPATGLNHGPFVSSSNAISDLFIDAKGDTSVQTALLGPNGDAGILLFDGRNFDEIYERWQPRDGISRWSDGTSNQFVFGERHVPTNKLSAPYNAGAGDAASPTELWDGSYLASTLGNGFNIVRLVNAPRSRNVAPYDQGAGGFGAFIHPVSDKNLGNKVEDKTRFLNEMAAQTYSYGAGTGTYRQMDSSSLVESIDTLCFRFGSAHTGVFNFALGDGAVRSSSTKTDIFVLVNLSDVDDGQVVSVD
jgi:hypothetical protein